MSRASSILGNVFRFASEIGTDLVVYCHGVPRAEVTAEDIRGYGDAFSRIGP